MRAGGCTVQQALTAEAANVVKQAVNLARRRGHAQVTPLHVANTMLAASTGLLRTACLQYSHSHPLQCKALELCFNVALNRLPALTTNPMLGGHQSQFPSVSNALVAAFKRAQAHQRRGSIENQQQPLLAMKIELEQLIISILDDPSVSRVMREAGFSSTQVKSNVEQAISSMEVSSKNPSVNKSKDSNNLLTLSQSPNILGQTGTGGKVSNSSSSSNLLSDSIRNEDVMYVVESLVNNKKRSFLIVGECLGSIEGVVKGVMEKVDKGDVPQDLKNVKFVSLSLPSFRHHTRDEIEGKIEEIKSLIKSYMGSGIVLFLGDLRWVAEYRTSPTVQNRSYYCPVEHMVNELGKLVCESEENGRFWLMGIATFQAYKRCKNGNPSLESVLGLQPVTIPSGSLRLSLVSDSDLQSELITSKKAENGSTWISLEDAEEKQLTCCANCSAKFESEARSLQSSSTNCNSESTSSNLPAWLKQYKEENRGNGNIDQNCVSVRELCRKWNSICNSIHKQSYSSERTLTFSSVVSPSSSTSIFSHDQQNPILNQTHLDNHFRLLNNNAEKPSFLKQALSSNPNSTPNSASSSDAMDVDCAQNKFKELNSENLKTLCDALEKKVPWQKDIVPEIASTILRCRSGLVRRKERVKSNKDQVKEETWLLFQGVDVGGKEKIAKDLAKLVFGSHEYFISIALSSFSSTRADSTDQDCRNKRLRDEQSGSYIERFAEALSSNPHRVFLVEDVDQADYSSQIGFKRAIESGRVIDSNGDEVCLKDAIIILSCESFSSRSRACSPPMKQKLDSCEEEKGDGDDAVEETNNPCLSLDLNISIDDESMEDQSIDDVGLLECVDRRVIFKIQELQ